MSRPPKSVISEIAITRTPINTHKVLFICITENKVVCRKIFRYKHNMIFGKKLEVKKNQKRSGNSFNEYPTFIVAKSFIYFKTGIILQRAVFCQSPAFQSALQAEVRAQTALPARRGLHILPEKGNLQSGNRPQQRKIQSQSLR